MHLGHPRHAEETRHGQHAPRMTSIRGFEPSEHGEVADVRGLKPAAVGLRYSSYEKINHVVISFVLGQPASRQTGGLGRHLKHPSAECPNKAFRACDFLAKRAGKEFRHANAADGRAGQVRGKKRPRFRHTAQMVNENGRVQQVLYLHSERPLRKPRRARAAHEAVSPRHAPKLSSSSVSSFSLAGGSIASNSLTMAACDLPAARARAESLRACASSSWMLIRTMTS